jgi:hypothetical protein
VIGLDQVDKIREQLQHIKKDAEVFSAAMKEG